MLERLLKPQNVGFMKRCVSSAMEEAMILVDTTDKPIGHKPKSECHQWKGIETGENLHRAFSVFLFGEDGRMVIQKRAAQKVTFPGLWTNACCSHPLYNPTELDEAQAKGVKRAARRKLLDELGLPDDLLSFSRLQYMTRILYKARCGDGPYGEHELDYLLMCRLIEKEEGLITPNPTEVADLKRVEAPELQIWMNERPTEFSPWFRLAMSKYVFDWWAHLSDLAKFVDHETIHSCD